VAYSTVLDVGYMALAMSFGAYGAYIALAYIFAHAVVKPTLFLSAGWVVKDAGTSNLEGLKGAFKGSPALMIAFLTGAAAVVGIPPTLLFQAKFALYQVTLYVTKVPQVFWRLGFYQPLTLIVMLLGSALALSGILKAVYVTYLTPGKAMSIAPTYLKIVVLSFAVGIVAFGIGYIYVSNYLIWPAWTSLVQGRLQYVMKMALLMGGGK
jgi:multicomponent Na+:H+ antiporter subunit D